LVSGACDPAQSDIVQQAVRDDIARFIAQLWLPEADRGALLEPELVAARTATGIRWALNQEDLGAVATAHATTLLLGQDVALDINCPQRLAVVVRKDLLRVAQAWLTGEPITVLANPKATTAIPITIPLAPVTSTATPPPPATTPTITTPTVVSPVAPIQPTSAPAQPVSVQAQPSPIPVSPHPPATNPAKP